RSYIRSGGHVRLGRGGNPTSLMQRITTVTIDNQRTGRIVPGAIAGILVGGLALGVAQLVAGLISSDSSPVVAVGQLSIDFTPPPVKNFAISAFGSPHKGVLVGGGLFGLGTF